MVKVMSRSSTRPGPASYVADSEGRACCTFHFRAGRYFPLGFEPRDGSYKRAGTPAARLVYEFMLNSLKEDDAQFSPADFHTQHAIHSLVGALFVPNSWCGSRPTDRLFCSHPEIIRDRLADPDFGPRELAADAGISLRCVHKLFTEQRIFVPRVHLFA